MCIRDSVQGYSNPETDKQWETAASEVDPAKRQALYTQLQTTLVNEVANGFLVDMEFPTLYRANVKNLVKTAIGLNEDVYKRQGLSGSNHVTTSMNLSGNCSKTVKRGSQGKGRLTGLTTG